MSDTTASSTAVEKMKKKSNNNEGGIAWKSGSLVGALNPNAPTGYRYSTVSSKRYRLSDESSKQSRELPANIQVQFRNRQGQELSTTLDLPVNSTVADLTALVHELLLADSDNNDDKNNSKIPYSFYASIPKDDDNSNTTSETEIVTSIADLLLNDGKNKNVAIISTEHVLQLTYQPLAVFRVRPVTRCTDTLQGHTAAVLHVSFAPHGRWLASGGGDCTVRFWDVHTGTTKFKPGTNNNVQHKDHVLCTAWSPDAQRFASADKRGVLIVWDPATGQPIGKRIQAHSKWITGLAWEPLHRCQEQQQGQCERIATSSRDGTVKLWNTRTGGSALKTLSGHTDSVEAIRWSGSSSGNLLYSASRDRSIKVWNVERGILVRTLQGHGHRVNALALSSDAVLRAGCFDYQNCSSSSSSSSNKSSLATTMMKDDPQWAVQTARKKYETHRQQHGEDKLVSGSDDFTLFIWNPETSKHPVKRLTGHQQAVNDIAYSPDGRYFASASFDKKVKLWNGFTGDFLMTFTGHVGAVYQVTWSADSRYLVSASKDSTAKLWEVSTGKKAKETLPGHADEVYALDWSPVTGSVATGSKDRTIKIWKH